MASATATHPGARSTTASLGAAAVRLVAAITLGSGLWNLYSVIGPALPQRVALLSRFFPLEFVHLAKFLTLLLGLALVISSVNVYRRKRRAYYTVLALSALSVLFHLSKGLDYEEASVSLGLMAVVLATRRSFTVRSSTPHLRSSLLRLAIAFVTAMGYGVAGFWLLEPREFGQNFNITASLRYTLALLAWSEPGITPQTHYAHWFLDSLHLATLAVLAYAGFTLFRPVVYRFATLPGERQRAKQIVERHGRSSLDYFKYWPDKTFFFSASERAFLSYRVAGGFAVVLADPVGPEEEVEPLLRDFRDFCRDNGWTLAFHQTLPDFLPFYVRAGFRKLKIGDDAVVDLALFSLHGKSHKEVRSRLHQLEKAGVRAQWFDPPIAAGILDAAREVSEEWLQIPGRRERSFTVGKFDPDYLRLTPLFAVVDGEGRMLAFANVVPSYRPGETTVDLMRRRIHAPNGTMDYLFVKLFLHQKESGFQRFNLGMAPMAGFQEREEAGLEERTIHAFFQRLNFLFSYSGLRAYKAKFATGWEPRYVIYRNALDLPRLAYALARVTEASEPEV